VVESYVVAITRESFDWKQIPRGAEACCSRSPHSIETRIARRYGIIHFATHGLAQLKLNADWVVLSAYSTIAGDKAWPRRGAASGHAGLSQRCLFAAQRLSGVLGAVCADRRGGRALKFSNCAVQQFRSGRAATDGRATTTPNPRKAPQHPVDSDQLPSRE